VRSSKYDRDDILTTEIAGNLTLCFILGDKRFLEVAKKLIKDNYEQTKEGDAIQAIFDWFKKFRGDYHSEENAVKHEFAMWFKIKKEVK